LSLKASRTLADRDGTRTQPVPTDAPVRGGRLSPGCSEHDAMSSAPAPVLNLDPALRVCILNGVSAISIEAADLRFSQGRPSEC
jgi:hypothetical protein